MRITIAFFGAAMLVAGVAAWVIDDRHRPHVPDAGYLLSKRTGWSATTFDLVRVASFALLIFGAVIVALTLIREYRRPA